MQVDGGLKTGRDVIVAMLLGAEEYGFSTAPLVVAGCVMMRVCHLDTCPVGVATQNPVLRQRYTGTPEFVETFFLFLAEQVREYLAQLGFRTVDEAVGHAELLDIEDAVRALAAGRPRPAPVAGHPDVDSGHRCTKPPKHDLSRTLDAKLIELAAPTLMDAKRVRIDLPIRNVDRTAGTMLGHEVTKRFGPDGLPDRTLDVKLTGTAGQSLGAFLPPGITITMVGDANDYIGKGLSGGRIVLRPHPQAPKTLPGVRQVIGGNTVAYGATAGEIFIRGRVGERFAVRNSGALLVVEGTGDHACEYMTGGRAIILGKTGRNVAAGMSGGIAYLLDHDESRINLELVEIEKLAEDEQVWLGDVLATHVALTGSRVAADLLDDWDKAIDRFVRIMPRDFKRVLELRAEAAALGVDADQMIMEASHG